MWVTSYHRFPSRAAFVEACLAAGWFRASSQELELPPGVAVDIIGPLIGPPQINKQGLLIPGEILDPRYHVNLAWHAQEIHPAFADTQIVPTASSRAFGIPPAIATKAAVPTTIAAWKGKAALREAGRLASAVAAVNATGGRVQDVWAGASEWERGSKFLTSLTTSLGLTSAQIDEMFRDADAIQS